MKNEKRKKKKEVKEEIQGVIKISQEMIIYNSPDGEVKIDVLLQNENIWLPQDKIAELFGITRTVVTKHIGNIFADGEMDKDSTCVKIAQVQILNDFGKVSHEIAKAFAEQQFEIYNKKQIASYESDFDRLLEITKKVSQ